MPKRFIRRSRHFGCRVTFEVAQGDAWTQTRSRLNHTHLANGVLWIWGASSRWDEIIEYLAGTAPWDKESRREWQVAARQWAELATNMVAHARKIREEYQPFRVAGELLRAGVPHGEECVLAARKRLAEDERHEAWIASVESGVSEVDVHRAAVDDAIKERDAGRKTACATSEEIREHLRLLAQSGQRLKDVFSGRGYFNHGESD
jgi:hypothetical protein